MIKKAKISDCRRYRWWLSRVWNPELPLLYIIMLNPSTATHEVDDATIRVCIVRAVRNGFGGIVVLNLFAYRATSPDDMKAAPDPVGHACNSYITTIIPRDGKVLCAWGNHGSFNNRDQFVKALLRGRKLYHLGLTKQGQPKHPLRIPYSQKMIRWRND